MTETADTDTYTPAHQARAYLTSLTTAFADGTRPTLDAAQVAADEFPEHFARLSSQWELCLDAAQVINDRYQEDWNRQGGALTVIAPAVRDAALSELRVVWNTLCRNYVQDTLDRLLTACVSRAHPGTRRRPPARMRLAGHRERRG